MEWRIKLIIMKKILFFLIIFAPSCMMPNRKTLDENKEFFINNVIGDSELRKQAYESGLFDKIKNASSIDSFTYYTGQFQHYNDSINSLKK